MAETLDHMNEALKMYQLQPMPVGMTVKALEERWMPLQDDHASENSDEDSVIADDSIRSMRSPFYSAFSGSDAACAAWIQELCGYPGWIDYAPNKPPRRINKYRLTYLGEVVERRSNEAYRTCSVRIERGDGRISNAKVRIRRHPATSNFVIMWGETFMLERKNLHEPPGLPAMCSWLPLHPDRQEPYQWKRDQ